MQMQIVKGFYFEIIAALVLENNANIQRNGVMTLNQYRRPKSLFDHGQRLLRFQNYVSHEV